MSDFKDLKFMKFSRYFLIITLFFCFTTYYSQKFNAGFSAGLTVSDIDGADTRDPDNDFHKVGFTAGALVNTQLTKKSILQFEINYIQKGSLQPPDSLNNGYFKIALGYVEIPILIKRQIYFNWKQKRINKLDIEFGLSYGRMVYNEVVGGTNYTLSSASQYYNYNDVSALLGLDYNFTKNIYFCFRYSNSLIPTIKKNSANYGTQSIYTINKGNSMVFQFSFKFVLNGKKQETTSVSTTPVTQ